MKAYGGVDDIFLISALVGGERSDSRPGQVYPWGKSPLYPSDRRLGGPQSRSGRRGEEKILDPTGTRIPIPRSSSAVASRYTDSRFYLISIASLNMIRYIKSN
jgi:hypothetical protein